MYKPIFLSFSVANIGTWYFFFFFFFFENLPTKVDGHARVEDRARVDNCERVDDRAQATRSTKNAYLSFN